MEIMPSLFLIMLCEYYSKKTAGWQYAEQIFSHHGEAMMDQTKRKECETQ
jgi:hypothetical protein